MNESQVPGIEPDVARVFRRVGGNWMWLWLTGGIALLAIGVLGLVVAMLFLDVGPVRLQLMTTAPILAGMSLVGVGLRSRSALDWVAADDLGLTMKRRSRTEHFTWAEIAWNSEAVAPLTNTKRSTLYGANGKVLTRIPACLEDWDQLVVLINRQVKAQADTVAESVRRGRLRRQGALLIGMGMVATAGTVFLTMTTLQEHRAKMLLERDGVEGTATVVRKFVAPNGRTRRLECQINASRQDGSTPEIQNVEVPEMLWDAVEVGGQIPAVYVPAEPDVFRVQGAIDDFTSEVPLPAIIGVGGVLCMMFLGAGVLNLANIDLVIDSETKKFRVARSVSK